MKDAMFNFFTIFIVYLAILPQLFGSYRGPYVGISTGATFNVGEQTGFLNSNFSFIDTQKDLNSDLFNVEGGAGVYAGYGLIFGRFYTGLEVFLSYFDSNFVEREQGIDRLTGFLTVTETIENKIRVGPFRYGIDARLGLQIDPLTLIYGRVGAEGASFELKSSSSVQGVFDGSPNVFRLPFFLKKSKHSAYLRIGAGIEKFILSYLSLRADYTFTDYGQLSVKKRLAAVVGGNALAVDNSSTIHLKDHSFLLGLSYHFCSSPAIRIVLDKRACFQGFYLGANWGFALFDAHYEPNNDIGAPGPIFPFTTSHHLRDTVFTESLMAGYSFQLCCFYAAVEGFGQYIHPFRERKDRLVFTGIPSNFSTESKILPYQFGIQVRPGILINPSTLIFGTFGTSYAKIKTKIAAAGQQSNLFASDRKVTSTLRVGGGLEYAMSPEWHLRLDYLFTSYGKTKLQNRATGPADVIINVDAKTHFRTHAFTVGFARYF